MKKRVLGIALAIVSMGFVVSAEAKAADVSQLNSTVAANAVPQWSVTVIEIAMTGVMTDVTTVAAQ